MVTVELTDPPLLVGVDVVVVAVLSTIPWTARLKSRLLANLSLKVEEPTESETHHPQKSLDPKEEQGAVISQLFGLETH